MWIAGLVACSSGDGAEDDTDAPADTTDTTADSDTGMVIDTDLPMSADTYVDGITKETVDGYFRVGLTFDRPPASGKFQVTIRVTDGTDTPVSGATVTFVPTMPMMGHGTEDVLVSEASGGDYLGAGVNFTMGGLWQIDVGVTLGGASDTAVFAFDL